MMRNVSTSLGVLICALAGSLSASTDMNIGASAIEKETASRDLAMQTLAGRKILVRVYKDWKVDPRAFDSIRVPITDLGIGLDAVKLAVPNLDESAVLVLVGEDQDDDAVAQILGNNVYAESYEKAKSYSIWPGCFERPDPEPLTFRDALGNPVPEASVETFLRHSSGEPEICFGKSSTDERGRLGIPNLEGSLGQFAFVISHPDYGVFRVARRLLLETELVVPSVSRTTEPYQRCARGTVMDPEGNAVRGARIQCTNVLTLGEGLINSLHGWTYEALTDKEGTFSLYLPNEKGRQDWGYLIPPKSKYNVRIDPPKELGLLPYVKPIENDRHLAILLERGGRFRTFVFEDAGGPITDQYRLQYIGVTAERPDESWLSIRYNDFKDGGFFPPGQYRAAMYGIANYEFEPLMVSEHSPDELVFRLPDGILYFGRIVHGLTGEVMPGAFVLAMNSKRRGNLSMITPEQWQALRVLPAEPSLSDPAVKPLREIYGIKKLVRTDDNGRFQMSLRPGEFYGFVAFAENFLGLMRRSHNLVPDESRYVEVPQIKLFPAATVLVEIFTQDRISIWPRWIIDKENNSASVRNFLASDDRAETMFTYDAWLEGNELQSFHVPSGLNLRVKLDCPYDDKWCPVEIPQVLNFAQGQVVDLGSHTFHPALAVTVYATDLLGEPVEGAPVRLSCEENSWGVAHNTDESGIARFHVVPHSEGQFGVLYHGRDGLHLTETIPYKIAGEEDAGRRFTMQLSDDMMYRLFKQNSP